MKQTISPFYTCMLLLAGTLLSSAALAEDIYKWLNDNGEVQYTQMPPPHGIKAIRIQSAPPVIDADDKPDTAPMEEQPVDQSVDNEFQGGREVPEDKTERDVEITRSMQENCKNARKNLVSLSRGQARYLKPDGSVFRMTEEERQRRIEEANEQIKLLCNS